MNVPRRPDLPPDPPRRERRIPSALIVLGLIALLGAGAIGLSRLVGGPDRVRTTETVPPAAPSPSDAGTRTAEPHRETDAGPATYRFLDRTNDGEPWRFDPCEPIAYVVNPTNAPRGALGDLRTAVHRLEEATGLRFVYEGTTDEVARPGRRAYQRGRYGDRWAPILVDWHDPADSPYRWRLPNEDLHALGLASPLWSPEHPGAYVSGTIVFNARDRGPAGFGWPWSHGVTMLHELGHVVGLAHVHAHDQVMSVDGYSTAKTYAEGDLAGLARLGADAGCITPAPVP